MVMTWLIAGVGLSLVMAALAITELRQVIKADALVLADRLFVICIFSVFFIYSLTLLVAKIFL
jgi:hypothetical protein